MDYNLKPTTAYEDGVKKNPLSHNFLKMYIVKLQVQGPNLELNDELNDFTFT